jgi:hypothetical protein
MGQARLARLLNTTEEGTDEHDIMSCLSGLSIPCDELMTSHHNDARKWLLQYAPMTPLILCVDRWTHWVCIAGQCGDRLWMFDPENSELNKKTNGASCLLPRNILKRWRNAKNLSDETGTLYYGIAVFPRT